MSNKISHRQQSGNAKREAPKKRSLIVKDMIDRGGGGSHTDKRERRANNPNRKRFDYDYDDGSY